MENQKEDQGYSGKQLQILEVAERLFAGHGYEGTSVRDIAQEAGVNVAMISYYFGSKEKLLHAVFANRIESGRLMMEHLLADTAMGPLEKIDAMVESMVERMLQHSNFHRVMIRAQLTGDHDQLTKLMLDTKLKNLEIVSKIIAEGQKKKVFTKGVDVPLLLMTVIGSVYQAAAGSAYYKMATAKEALPDEEAQGLLKQNLKQHLKRLLKATLTYEGK